ncbi:MAG: MerR family transcriptional regulator [Streptosporangiaceae bacterium]
MGRDYRIDELAEEAGIPVRTLRYYQERRLLPAPRRSGRVAVYSDAHLTRLRLIADLLERGHRLDGIEELLTAGRQGRDVSELLGVAAPWAEQAAIEVGLDDLVGYFGDQLTDEVMAEAIELGYIEIDGDRIVHRAPRLFEATISLVQEGIPLAAILTVSWELEAAFDRMAFAFVELARKHVIDPETSAAVIAAAVDRIRPVARTVADEHFARAMDRRIHKEFPELSARLGEPT